MIAIGSGGPFGVGLGESVQKLFYLPEAHTDMILAVIGEELGFAGISVVLFLYGMIAYAGLRAARTAKDHYAKLLAAGITSVILIQAIVELLRGAGRAAADRCAAAVHLLREQQPDRAARGDGTPDQRRARGRAGRPQARAARDRGQGTRGRAPLRYKANGDKTKRWQES